MPSNLVSVLIPVYNRELLVVRAVQSALAQTHGNLQIVVIDNASTDDTWNVVMRLAAEDRRIVPLRNETNIGPTRNWIRGLEHCTGDFVKVLWSDDWIEPTFIEELLEPMLDRPDVGLAFSAAIAHYADHELRLAHFPDRRWFTSDEYLADALSAGRTPVSPGCALARRSVAEFRLPIGDSPELNRIAERFGAGPDLLFLMLAAASSKQIAHAPKFLGHFDGGRTSITVNHEAEVSLGYRLTREWFAEQLADRPALAGVRRKLRLRRWRKSVQRSVARVFGL